MFRPGERAQSIGDFRRFQEASESLSKPNLAMEDHLFQQVNWVHPCPSFDFAGRSLKLLRSITRG